MGNDLTISLPALYPEQRAAFYDPARIVAIDGSTKSGKTIGAISWQLDQAINRRPGQLHLWIAMTHPQSEVAFQRVVRMFQRAEGLRGKWDKNISTQTIYLPGGSRIKYMGSENYDSIYSRDAGSAVLDEASRCKREAYIAVVSVTTSTGGPIRCIGNVVGRGNWFYQLGAKARAGAPNMAYHKLTAEHALRAGIITQSVLDDAKQQLTEQEFRQLYFCEPADDGGNPFGLDAIQRAYQHAATPGPPVVFGVDLAKSTDYTVVIGIDENGTETHMSRWNNVPWSVTQDRIAQIVGDTPCLIDSTGLGDPVVEALQHRCPMVEGFKFTSMSKQQIMEGLAVALQTGAIRLTSQELRSELEAFEYEYTRTGVRYSAPDGLHDDAVCALALAVSQMRRAVGAMVYDSDPRIISVDNWGQTDNILARMPNTWD